MSGPTSGTISVGGGWVIIHGLHLVAAYRAVGQAVQNARRLGAPILPTLADLDARLGAEVAALVARAGQQVAGHHRPLWHRR